jgi:tetratricopeptide (TPR) repeat protein
MNAPDKTMTRSSLPNTLQHPLAIPLLLVLVTFLAYANSFPGIFIQDDIYIVRDNPLVANLDLWKILRSEYWAGIESNGLYRPLTILSLALNRLLLGPEAVGFHLVNVLLHAGVTLLLWHLLRRWDINASVAFLAALLFAAHPIHAEVINIVVGRSELLAALFLLLALVAATGLGRRAAGLTGLYYLAALLSKEHAVTLLLLIPLRDWFVTGSVRQLRARLSLYGVLVGVTVVWLVWRQFVVVQEFHPSLLPPEVLPLAHLTWLNRFLSAVLLQWYYLFKLLLPTGLQGVYAVSDLPLLVDTPLSLRGVMALSSVVAALALLVRGWRRRWLVALPVACYLTAFVLTANLFFPIGVTFAERLAYFPSLWFCAGVAVLAGALFDRPRTRRVGLVVSGGYLLLLLALTVVRNADFSNELRYWEADLRQNPGDHLALINYVGQLIGEERWPEVESAYAQIFEIVPEFAYAYRSRFNFLYDTQRYAEAHAAINKALAISRERGDRTGMAYDLGDLAKLALVHGDYARALALLDESAAILGRDDFDLNLRGQALAGLRRHDEALTAFEQSGNSVALRRVRQDQALAHFNAGQLTAARAELEALTANGEAGAEVWNLLGATAARLGDWPAAVAAFAQAVRLAPDNRYYAENLEQARREGRP